MSAKIWTQEEDDFIRKNIRLTNAELAKRLGRTQASIENRVRGLGLSRIFSKDEVETLKAVWGKSRIKICRALPKYTWRQISLKAGHLGLPLLKDVQDSVHLYSIVSAMGVGTYKAQMWQDAGLKVTNDRARKMRCNVRLVAIDDFWDFAMKHPELVDLTKLKENVFDVLGAPPLELLEMQKGLESVETRVKYTRIQGDKRKEIAKLYYGTSVATKDIAASFNVSEDTIRHIAARHKVEGQKRTRARTVTPQFLKRLERLYYTEGKTRQECADALGCSTASIHRGITKLTKQKQVK